MSVDPCEAGIIRRDNGETVILLPPGPIRSEVLGSSGMIYQHILFDSPVLGRPTHKLEPSDPPKNTRIHGSWYGL